jgi:hypothetical protein
VSLWRGCPCGCQAAEPRPTTDCATAKDTSDGCTQHDAIAGARDGGVGGALVRGSWTSIGLFGAVRMGVQVGSVTAGERRILIRGTDRGRSPSGANSPDSPAGRTGLPGRRGVGGGSHATCVWLACICIQTRLAEVPRVATTCLLYPIGPDLLDPLILDYIIASPILSRRSII